MRILKNLLKPFLGKKQLYGFYHRLYLLSLKGMNIGGGSTFSDSGEEWVLQFLMQAGKPFVLFDVGANKGNYTLLADKVAKAKAIQLSVYCFEPGHKTFELLTGNVKEKPGIRTFNIGLGKEPGQLKLHYDQEGSGLASLYERDLSAHNMSLNKAEQVTISTVDSFCMEHGVNHIDLLKLDIEGFELSALQGAREMLERGAVEAVQFEFGGTAIDARVYLRDFFNLLSKNYQIYRVLKNGIAEISKYNETEELFTTTNYLAIKRHA